MQTDENTNHKPDRVDGPRQVQQGWSQRMFTTPAPLKKLFEKVPLITYESNQPPARSLQQRNEHRLYVFSTPEDAKVGRPSYNPRCLKWQAYLRFRRIEHQIEPSSNHSSPTGILPFLLPAVSSSTDSVRPIATNKLKKWVEESTFGPPEPYDMRYDGYMAFLDGGGAIRNAWLYALYLQPENFESVAYRLYVVPCSSSYIVRTSVSKQLQLAARKEIAAGSSTISVPDLYGNAEEAFASLSALLGDDEYFFGVDEPSLFDASIFAYTHLISDSNLGWEDDSLGQILRRFSKLTRHENRIMSRYFS